MTITHELDKAVASVVRSGRATPGVLQRELGVAPSEARRLLKQLEWLGGVGRVGGRRLALMTPEEWAEVLADSGRSMKIRQAS